MTSVELTKQLYKQGFFSKEAAVRVLQKREKLLKQAMVDWTNSYFGFEKTATGPFDVIKRLLGGSEKAVSRGSGGPVGMIDSMKNIAPLLGIAGLIALGTTAAKVGLGAIGNIKTKRELEDSYNQIFKEFPELEENRPQAQKFFNMMAKFSPVLASNPIVAGTWVKGTMGQNVVAPQNIHQLIDAQGQWEKNRAMKSPFLGFTQEFPAANEILKKTIITHGLGSGSSDE